MACSSGCRRSNISCRVFAMCVPQSRWRFCVTLEGHSMRCDGEGMKFRVDKRTYLPQMYLLFNCLIRRFVLLAGAIAVVDSTERASVELCHYATLR